MVSFSHFLIPLFPIALFFIFLNKRQHRNNAGKTLPPSPRKLPVIGNLHQLGLLPYKALQSMSREHGPLMLLHLGRVPVLVVSSADAAREIMKNQDAIFSNRPKLTIPDKLFYGSNDVAFAPYGEYWRKMKSICVLHFLSGKKVQSYRRVREEETSLMIDNITKLSGGDNSVVNLSNMLALLTNDVLCRVALGSKYSNKKEGKEFKMMLGEAVELGGTFCVGDYIPWLSWLDRGVVAKADKLAKRFDQFLERVLDEHRSKNGATHGVESSVDFVDLLLEYQRGNKDNYTIGDDNIKAVIRNMFGDGTDTTYTALEWTMAELIKHPNKMEKLQSEVRKVAGERENITEDDLDKMPYLKAVIKETLRLHTPVPLLAIRESTQDTKVMGYDVADKTQVIVNAWSIGRDPSLWENAQEFKPERFLDSSVDFRGFHFELIPFGAGRRGCPGISYAMALNELAIAKLVHKFDFDLPDGASKTDLDLSEAAGITVHIKSPLLVVATPYAATC